MKTIPAALLAILAFGCAGKEQETLPPALKSGFPRRAERVGDRHAVVLRANRRSYTAPNQVKDLSSETSYQDRVEAVEGGIATKIARHWGPEGEGEETTALRRIDGHLAVDEKTPVDYFGQFEDLLPGPEEQIGREWQREDVLPLLFTLVFDGRKEGPRRSTATCTFGDLDVQQGRSCALMAVEIEAEGEKGPFTMTGTLEYDLTNELLTGIRLEGRQGRDRFSVEGECTLERGD